MKRKIIILFLMIGILPAITQAAELYFRSPLGKEAAVGQKVSIEILLDSNNENLNAIEAEIGYPKALLKPVSFSDGSSIINLWIERPDLLKDSLVLRGIMPGGYNWNGGLLGKLDFKTLKPGLAEIKFRAGAKVFLNDGLGTEAKVGVKNLKFSILNSNKAAPLEEADQYPPERFNLEVSKDPNVFDNKYFLVFATQDKQSGLDHYEIQETGKQQPETNLWERAESPYLLKDQTRESYIFVKAVDRKGNERIENIYPISYKPWYQRPVTYIIVALFLVLTAIIIKRLVGSAL